MPLFPAVTECDSVIVLLPENKAFSFVHLLLHLHAS